MAYLVFIGQIVLYELHHASVKAIPLLEPIRQYSTFFYIIIQATPVEPFFLTKIFTSALGDSSTVLQYSDISHSRSPYPGGRSFGRRDQSPPSLFP